MPMGKVTVMIGRRPYLVDEERLLSETPAMKAARLAAAQLKVEVADGAQRVTVDRLSLLHTIAIAQPQNAGQPIEDVHAQEGPGMGVGGEDPERDVRQDPAAESPAAPPRIDLGDQQRAG